MVRSSPTNLLASTKRFPDNEFSEQFTGDMPSADRAIYYLMNPEKSDFPEAAKRQCRWWKNVGQSQGEVFIKPFNIVRPEGFEPPTLSSVVWRKEPNTAK